MSQENVELARELLAAFNRRDRAAWLALCDPELENIPPRDWPESDPIRGVEPVFDFYVETQEAWGEGSLPYEYVELMDLGHNTVVGLMSTELRGKASGASVPWSYWQLVTFRDGSRCVSNGSWNEPRPSEPPGCPSRR